MDEVPGPIRRASRDGGAGDPLVLSVAQAAELLGVSRSFAYSLVSCGDLAAVRVGRRLLVRCDAVYEYLDRHVVDVAASVGS